MSAFDVMQRVTFAAVHRPFGDVATWTPSDGGENLSGKIFFSDPTDLQGFARDGAHAIGFPEFDTDAPVMEYLSGTFPGLKEAVDRKSKEFVFIKGTRYQVKKVKTKGDGKSIYASIFSI